MRLKEAIENEQELKRVSIDLSAGERTKCWREFIRVYNDEVILIRFIGLLILGLLLVSAFGFFYLMDFETEGWALLGCVGLGVILTPFVPIMIYCFDFGTYTHDI